MDDELAELNLVQMVNFSTWSRIVNGVKQMSILDHTYTSDPTAISNLYSETPVFGDHLAVIFNCGIKNEKKTVTYRRNWLKYSKKNFAVY
jgi:hypothetical protein